jgi:hypothetical protein
MTGDFILRYLAYKPDIPTEEDRQTAHSPSPSSPPPAKEVVETD